MNLRQTATRLERVPAGSEDMPGDLTAALLSPDGGGGAELRGHVPARPEGVVLVLHGGTSRSRATVSWWRLAVVRMLPFATTIQHRAGDRLAVLRLKNRVRGWNGSRKDPVQDARWALERIRRVLPGTPVALVDEPDVVAVAALAPWIEGDSRRPRRDVKVLLMHGTNDRITDPRRTSILARTWAETGSWVRFVPVRDETHAMIRQASLWHVTVGEFVVGALTRRGRAG